MEGLDPTYATPPETNMDTQDDGLEKVYKLLLNMAIVHNLYARFLGCFPYT